MSFYFFKAKIIANRLFLFILVLTVQFINIKNQNYSEIIHKNIYLFNNLTEGNNLRFCKECICVKAKQSYILCLIKKKIYILEQYSSRILTISDELKNLTVEYYNLIPVNVEMENLLSMIEPPENWNFFFHIFYWK